MEKQEDEGRMQRGPSLLSLGHGALSAPGAGGGMVPLRRPFWRLSY